MVLPSPQQTGPVHRFRVSSISLARRGAASVAPEWYGCCFRKVAQPKRPFVASLAFRARVVIGYSLSVKRYRADEVFSDMTLAGLLRPPTLASCSIRDGFHLVLREHEQMCCVFKWSLSAGPSRHCRWRWYSSPSNRDRALKRARADFARELAFEEDLLSSLAAGRANENHARLIHPAEWEEMNRALEDHRARKK